MNGKNPKRYPRSLESNYSLLRIRAPEHLDVALEGLIRKVLKEQPKMDDIYQFAADYFDMLLKIREKAGVRKLTIQDICPHHNEEDAHEMIKLASSFTKRKKESKQYRLLSLRNGEQNKFRKFPKFDLDEDAIGMQNEVTEPKDVEIQKIENEEVKKEEIFEKKEELEKESKPDYSSRVSTKDIGEQIFIKANEVVTAYNKGEDTPDEALENNVDKIGDINELRDKIKAVENEIELLNKKGDERLGKDSRKDNGKTSSQEQVESGESLEKGTEMIEQDQVTETGQDISERNMEESNQDVTDERKVQSEIENIGDSQEVITANDINENMEMKAETGVIAGQIQKIVGGTQEIKEVSEIIKETDEEDQNNLEQSLEMLPETIAETEEEKNEVSSLEQLAEVREIQMAEQEEEEKQDARKGEELVENQGNTEVVTEVKGEEDHNERVEELTKTEGNLEAAPDIESEEQEDNEKGREITEIEITENKGDVEAVPDVENEEQEDDGNGGGTTEIETTESKEDVEALPDVENEEQEDDGNGGGTAEIETTESKEDVEAVLNVENEEQEDDGNGGGTTEIATTESKEDVEAVLNVENEEQEDDGNGGVTTESKEDVEAVPKVENEEQEDDENGGGLIETRGEFEVVQDLEKELKENQKGSEEAAQEVENELKDNQEGSEEATKTLNTETEAEADEEQEKEEKKERPAEVKGVIEAATELEKEEQEDNTKEGEPPKTQGDTVVMSNMGNEENKSHEGSKEPTTEQEEAEMKKEVDKKEEQAETQGRTEIMTQVEKEQKVEKELEKPREDEPKLEKEQEMQREKIDIDTISEEVKEQEDQNGSEELPEAQIEEMLNQKETEVTELDEHLTTIEEKSEQAIKKIDEAPENLHTDTEEQKAEERSLNKPEISEKIETDTDVEILVQEKEIGHQRRSEKTVDGIPDAEAGLEENRLEKSRESQEYKDDIAEGEIDKEQNETENFEPENLQQEICQTEKNDERPDTVPANIKNEKDGKIDGKAQRETLKEPVPSLGTEIIGNASEALIFKETGKKIEEQDVKELKEEQMLIRNQPAKAESIDIQDFLMREREYSSHDKQGIDTTDSASQENSVESEIKSRSISVLGLTYGKELNTDNASVKVSVIEPDHAIDVVADDYQERDSSTTSDEIEFEISPVKYLEAEQISRDKDEQSKVKSEPEIVLDLQTEDSEVKLEEDVESKDETDKTFLKVPETVLEEYNVIKESVVEEPTKGQEIILACSNIGNEIIQTREVEKVELLEGDEDILQIHLTTTIETEQCVGDSVAVEVSSNEPNFKVYVEAKTESPNQRNGNEEKLRMVRAAVVIQNGFRRFKNRKHSREFQSNDKPIDIENGEIESKFEKISSLETSPPDITTTISTQTFQKEKSLGRTKTRVFLETRSLEPFKKVSPLKTRSLSTIRNGIGDFEVWNQLVQELEEAATKIQSNYRGYKTRKKLQRGNAIQSTATASEESDIPEYNQSHTGEFHDIIVLPYHPK